MLLFPLVLLLFLPTLALGPIHVHPLGVARRSAATSSQCTEAAPADQTWINKRLSCRQAQTLCLKNGTYTGDQSMIAIPETFARHRRQAHYHSGTGARQGHHRRAGQPTPGQYQRLLRRD